MCGPNTLAVVRRTALFFFLQYPREKETHINFFVLYWYGTTVIPNSISTKVGLSFAIVLKKENRYKMTYLSTTWGLKTDFLNNIMGTERIPGYRLL